MRLWKDMLTKSIQKNYTTEFTLIDSRQLVGLFECIFIRTSQLPNLKHVGSSIVKTGLSGYHGNKGAVISRFVIDDGSFCFVNCHLAAHQKEINARNMDCLTIMKKGDFRAVDNEVCTFRSETQGTQIIVIKSLTLIHSQDHDHIFWLGDLNYRIDLDLNTTLDLIQKKDYKKLYKHDQLNKQLQENANFALIDFKEAELMHDPTFKYDIGTQNYDSSEKQRIPAWCDRILWKSENTRITRMRRLECLLSDHRMVSGEFVVVCKKVVPEKYRETLKAVMIRSDEERLRKIRAIKHQFYNS